MIELHFNYDLAILLIFGICVGELVLRILAGIVGMDRPTRFDKSTAIL